MVESFSGYFMHLISGKRQTSNMFYPLFLSLF